MDGGIILKCVGIHSVVLVAVRVSRERPAKATPDKHDILGWIYLLFFSLGSKFRFCIENIETLHKIHHSVS